MRGLIADLFVTLDGFIAGPQNDLDFVVPDDDLDRTMMTEELTARADTIMVGRKSFTDMAGYWTTATGVLARWMNGTPKVVLSNTLDDASRWPNSSVASGDGAEVSDGKAFAAHWNRILGDETIVIKTVLFDGRVAGNVSSFAHPTRDKPHELVPEQKGRRS